MICRIWHGWTNPENADAYERLLRSEIFRRIVERSIPGYRGIERQRIARQRLGRRTFFHMERIRAGRAYCALCGNAIRPDDDALLTPDFIADDADPLWRFADAAMHRACFLVWDRRKAFVTRYNRLARRWVAPDGTGWRMTSEGDVVLRAVQYFKRRG